MEVNEGHGEPGFSVTFASSIGGRPGLQLPVEPLPSEPLPVDPPAPERLPSESSTGGSPGLASALSAGHAPDEEAGTVGSVPSPNERDPPAPVPESAGGDPNS